MQASQTGKDMSGVDAHPSFDGALDRPGATAVRRFWLAWLIFLLIVLAALILIILVAAVAADPASISPAG